MKNLVLALVCLAHASLFSQSIPKGISYQAVAINTEVQTVAGINPVNSYWSNKDIQVRFTIYDQYPGGSAQMVEIHQVTTDKFGVFNVVIGQGQNISGDLFEVEWDKGLAHLQVEIDFQNNGLYKLIGIERFWSVPYAINSSKSLNSSTNYSNLDSLLESYQKQINQLRDSIYLDNKNDLDTDSTNELQRLLLQNDTLRLSKSDGFVVLSNSFLSSNDSLYHLGKSDFEQFYEPFELNSTFWKPDFIDFLHAYQNIYVQKGDSFYFLIHYGNSNTDIALLDLSNPNDIKLSRAYYTTRITSNSWHWFYYYLKSDGKSFYWLSGDSILKLNPITGEFKGEYIGYSKLLFDLNNDEAVSYANHTAGGDYIWRNDSILFCRQTAINSTTKEFSEYLEFYLLNLSTKKTTLMYRTNARSLRPGNSEPLLMRRTYNPGFIDFNTYYFVGNQIEFGGTIQKGVSAIIVKPIEASFKSYRIWDRYVNTAYGDLLNTDFSLGRSANNINIFHHKGIGCVDVSKNLFYSSNCSNFIPFEASDNYKNIHLERVFSRTFIYNGYHIHILPEAFNSIGYNPNQYLIFTKEK